MKSKKEIFIKYKLPFRPTYKISWQRNFSSYTYCIFLKSYWIQGELYLDSVNEQEEWHNKFWQVQSSESILIFQNQLLQFKETFYLSHSGEKVTKDRRCI